MNQRNHSTMLAQRLLVMVAVACWVGMIVSVIAAIWTAVPHHHHIGTGERFMWTAGVLGAAAVVTAILSEPDQPRAGEGSS